MKNLKSIVDPNTGKEYWSRDEIAKVLSVDPEYLRQNLYDAEVRFKKLKIDKVKVGNVFFYNPTDINLIRAFINQRKNT